MLTSDLCIVLLHKLLCLSNSTETNSASWWSATLRCKRTPLYYKGYSLQTRLSLNKLLFESQAVTFEALISLAETQKNLTRLLQKDCFVYSEVNWTDNTGAVHEMSRCPGTGMCRFYLFTCFFSKCYYVHDVWMLPYVNVIIILLNVCIQRNVKSLMPSRLVEFEKKI